MKVSPVERMNDDEDGSVSYPGHCGSSLVKLNSNLALTLCLLMNSSIRFYTFSLGWFIGHIEGP